MSNNQELEEQIETGYIQDGEASRHYFVYNKVSMPIEWADIVVPYIKDQQLALINKIEELAKERLSDDALLERINKLRKEIE